MRATTSASHNGTRDGSLTRGETNRLDHNQNRIDRYQANARSDGRVTPVRARPHRPDAEQPEPAHLQRPPQRAHAAHGARAAAVRQRGNGGWRMQQAEHDAAGAAPAAASAELGRRRLPHAAGERPPRRRGRPARPRRRGDLHGSVGRAADAQPIGSEPMESGRAVFVAPSSSRSQFTWRCLSPQ